MLHYSGGGATKVPTGDFLKCFTVSSISGGFLQVLVWWTGLTFPLYMSPSDFPPDCVLQPQKGGKESMVDDLY